MINKESNPERILKIIDYLIFRREREMKKFAEQRALPVCAYFGNIGGVDLLNDKENELRHEALLDYPRPSRHDARVKVLKRVFRRANESKKQLIIEQNPEIDFSNI